MSTVVQAAAAVENLTVDLAVVEVLAATAVVLEEDILAAVALMPAILTVVAALHTMREATRATAPESAQVRDT